MIAEHWQAWATLGVVASMAVALLRSWGGPDVILLAGLAVLVALGVVPAGEAIVGFGNEGLVTVGLLFVVVAGLTQTGAMALVVQPLLGLPKSIPSAQSRLMLPVAVMSAFMNNTPLVAMFMPVVGDWCKKTGISPSKLFIPLSYAAILGGTCSMIGTSTNLVVNGLLLGAGYEELWLLEIGWVGLPAAVLGLVYILTASRWLLRSRKPAINLQDDPRQYTVEMLVDPAGPLVGQSIEQAGLRHLPGLFLAEIDRDGTILAAVSPTERLQGGDRLIFVGVLESVVDLRKIRGLSPATDQVFKLDAPRTQRCLVEAVVSDSCPAVGKSIRAARFRSTYNAVVIAAARNGERILNKKIGDIVVHPGDTLLLEAHPSFVNRQRNSRDFFLVSQVADSAPPRHERALVALAILAAMVIAATFGLVSILTAALVASVGMIAARCCTGSEARQSVDWQVLLVIGAAFGIGVAMRESGAAAMVAGGLVDLAAGNAWLTLVAIYLVTNVFTAFVTNNAAAVLVFPIAYAAAQGLGANFLPYAVAIMMAASNDYATPIGYQTNLMVYGPGGYRFSDYVRFGLPLNLLVMVVSITLIPIIWPLR